MILAALPLAAPILITVGGTPKPINPLIYGVNFATQAQATALRLPLNRSGGNATTRYNWQQNCTSSASDWYFFSHAEPGTQPGEAVDSFVQGNVSAGTASMVTIPIIGYVAKIHPNRDPMWSFSVAKYGPQQQVEPWHSDAGNGVRMNGQPVTGNDPNDANIPVTTAFQQPWIQHLMGRFGSAANGGVGFYLLDNEPGLWHETHRDVHPAGATMQQLFDKQKAAAQMVKTTDPGAKVCGPEEWGWLSYLYSGSDFQWLAANNWQGNPPDRAAHGNMDQAPWLLRQFKNASAQAGTRLLDVFALHYYPQGSYGWSDVSENAQLWRNRSTRSLWDPNYTDESWINAKINLIPRMKAWVDAEYPGTQLGITEYNWGADDHINGATTQADVLGLLGKHGVDLATRWVCPPTDSPAYKAFQMFRNYDGLGGRFGAWSVAATGSNPDTVAAFASIDKGINGMKVMLINKQLSASADVDVTSVIAPRRATAQVWRLGSSNQIQRLSDVSTTNSVISVTLPAQSITLLVVRY